MLIHNNLGRDGTREENTFDLWVNIDRFVNGIAEPEGRLSMKSWKFTAALSHTDTNIPFPANLAANSPLPLRYILGPGR